MKKRNAKKSRFWIWDAYSTVKGRAFVTRIDGLSDVTTRRLLVGERLPRAPRLVVTDYSPTSGRFVDQLGCYIGLRLVSPPLAAVLRESPCARVQIVPVSVRGKPKLKYFIANVLDAIPALDIARSRLTFFEGTDVIDRVLRFALRPIADDAPPIFRVAEYRTLVIVNDELRQRLEAASPHPGVLTPAETWKQGF